MAAPIGNLFALGNTGGVEPFYETPEELSLKIGEYFDLVGKDGPRITGLALYLGFQSRQSFYDYEKKQEFTYTIKRARTAIEYVYECQLSGKNPTGAIFALKNMGWIDKVDHNVKSTNLNADLTNLSKEEIQKLNEDLEGRF